MKAIELMTQPLIFAHLKDSIHEVARLFVEKKISGLPVLNELGDPVGVITKTDLARYDRERLGMFTAERDPGRLIAEETHETISQKRGYHVEAEEESIESWLTPKIYAVSEEESFLEVMKTMTRRHIHRVFVAERGSGRLLGVITSMDLLNYMTGRELKKRRARRKSQSKAGMS